MDDIFISIYYASKKWHILDIEWFNQTVKERVLYAWVVMTFKIVSKLVIIHIFATAIFCLNYFPSSRPGSGLSNTKGPGKIIPGTVVDYNKVFRLQQGGYVQVHQYSEPQNTINIDQTVVAIVLFPQYNLQSSYLFEILLTGKHL